MNHGLALSRDGKTIYASSSEAVYSWAYDPEDAATSGTKKTLVTGMFNTDHNTRTILLSQKADGLLLVSRGSTSNIDAKAEVLSSGHSQLKAFNLNNITDNGYDFTADGLRLGWGLRNSVGVAEHPDTGGIYSVENSVDEMTRDGKDVHQDNPGEEMNFHGYLNGTAYALQGSNYGYPNCFAAWMPDDLPQNANLTVGSQFAIGDQNNTVNDTFCSLQTPPRLTFQAHMAPLDIQFNNSGSEAWVTFHGSWYVQWKHFINLHEDNNWRMVLLSVLFTWRHPLISVVSSSILDFSLLVESQSYVHGPRFLVSYLQPNSICLSLLILYPLLVLATGEWGGNAVEKVLKYQFSANHAQGSYRPCWLQVVCNTV